MLHDVYILITSEWKTLCWKYETFDFLFSHIRVNVEACCFKGDWVRKISMHEEQCTACQQMCLSLSTQENVGILILIILELNKLFPEIKACKTVDV